jgi:hypothetical protein
MEKLIILKVIDDKSVPDSSIIAFEGMIKCYNSKSIIHFAESTEHGLRVLIGNQAAKEALDDLTHAAITLGKAKE